MIESSTRKCFKILESNGKIITDTLTNLNQENKEIDPLTALYIIELYQENERALHEHLEDCRKVLFG